MTRWPGSPEHVLLLEQLRDPASAVLHWLPTPDDLPPWRSPQELFTNYTAVPPWWQRWLLSMAVAWIGAIVVFSTSLTAERTQKEKVAALIAVVVVLVTVVVNLVLELRFQRRKATEVQKVFALLQHVAVPVWVVLQDRVRVSGSGDSVYDLQFVFDLRVPRSVLALQRRVVDAWLDRMIAVEDRFEQDFASDGPVHCADIFGETMRGVWIWKKGSVLPIQVLGLAVDDPRITESLCEENVAFIRAQPRELRRRSRIS